MTTLVFLIEQTAIGWYIGLAVGIVWYSRRWLNAGYAYRATVFELERDIARNERGAALAAMVLCVEAALIVAGMQRVVAPTIRIDQEQRGDVIEVARADDGDFATPTRLVPSGGLPVEIVEASGNINLGGDDAPVIFATAILTPTPVGTIEPNAPDPVGCTTENAMLQIPANGMRVFEPIPVVGTAFIDNFSNYKIEVLKPGANPEVYDSGVTPVNERGTLSQFNPADYEPGTYNFQLMVFDTAQVLKASCRVSIYISEPIPTPTPLGS